MYRWAGRVALVTGASGGMGASLAEKLVTSGMKVVGCARNVEAIEELSHKLKNEKGQLVVVKCDVAKESEILALFEKTKAEFGGVDICVNSAGLSHAESLLNGDTEKWRHMTEVNILGVAICTREAVKSMRERKVDDGHIINLNSMSGHRILNPPDDSMYSATKFAVTGMTEALRCQLRQIKSNIRVSQVSPGLVGTDFLKNMHQWTAAENEQFFTKNPSIEAGDITDAIIYLLSAPTNVQVHDILIRPTQQIE